jgi:alcohol dehydrogenase (NADP+)
MLRLLFNPISVRNDSTGTEGASRMPSEYDVLQEPGLSRAARMSISSAAATPRHARAWRVLHISWRDPPVMIPARRDTVLGMTLRTDSTATHDTVLAHGTRARAYAAAGPSSGLQPFGIDRRAVGPHDVQVQILYCGVCHSDLHTARNEWKNTIYPCVPGHEIVGRVSAVGSAVTRFKAGELAGVGCLVGSCGTCASCREGLEQYCENVPTFTYNSLDPATGRNTYGGYSESIVVHEAFVLRIPENLPLPAVAPLLCAGITTYSPLRHWNVGTGQKVGVVGLGGLGHMAVKFAHAMGAHVVLFTTSPGKIADGRRLGAAEVIVSSSPEEMATHARTFDFILDTVSAWHDIDVYLQLLKRDGTLTLVGAPEDPLAVAAFGLLMGRRRLAGSGIGGIKETQEMLDFCAAHGITADVEMIDMHEIDRAYERLLRSDVKYRFVIDMASIGRTA